MENSLNVFKHLDYKELLREAIDENMSVYGFKSKLADAAGCGRSFFSQVLNSHVHLTPEHALGISKVLELNKSSQEYFIELVHLARAGSPELKEYIHSKLGELKRDYENLINRFSSDDLKNTADASLYYSHWYYTAIHGMLTIPRFKRVKEIANHLELSESLVQKVLSELQDLGFVKCSDNSWEVTENNIHVPRDSYFVTLNHANWRKKANENSALRKTESLHFTAVYTMSRQDLEKLKEYVFKLIDESREITEHSKEEEMVNLNIDLYSV